ncbi:heterokaryon incompatibility protein [Rutstroemia sp. NJR-2017a BBW]|nr:heterokaryon incompatibility protein [Rutstroemia sp. NJR-2017a BBW]
MKTVQANLDAHLQSIYFDDFPKTIQDAITITRQLGIKYLWVDALCIIQDLREDFIREVALMTDIYANSTLTISAEDATDCSKGIFKDRNLSSTTILPLGLRLPSNNGENRQTPKCASVSAIPKLVSQNEHERRTHLATRGWTLQEYALSSRMLCYSSADLKWRCSKEVWSQSLQLIRDPTWRNLKTNLSRKPGSGRDTMGVHWVFQTWISLISDYTGRELTDPRDSLFAVAGLQSRIATIIEDVPSIGMWRGPNFWKSLLWFSRPRVLASNRFHIRCPSWSWASACSPVKYLEYRSQKSIILPELRSWDLETVEDNVHIRGSITLKCPLLPGSILRDIDKTHILENYKDPNFPENDGNLWLLHLLNEYLRPGDRKAGTPFRATLMFIEKISPDKMHFRRVGLAQVIYSELLVRRRGMETIQLF